MKKLKQSLKLSPFLEKAALHQIIYVSKCCIIILGSRVYQYHAIFKSILHSSEVVMCKTAVAVLYFKSEKL